MVMYTLQILGQAAALEQLTYLGACIGLAPQSHLQLALRHLEVCQV